MTILNSFYKAINSVSYMTFVNFAFIRGWMCAWWGCVMCLNHLREAARWYDWLWFVCFAC